MKRLLVTSTLALSLSCGAAFAQQATDPQPVPQSPDAPMHHGHHRPNPHRQAEMLSRRLNLTSDQTNRIEPILAARDQQLQSLHGNAQLTPEDRHTQMRSINQTVEQQMATVLTPDQMTQLKELRSEMRHRGHMRHESENAGSPAPAA